MSYRPFVEALVKSVVEFPDQIEIEEETDGGTRTFFVRCSPEDVGKVIGKSGNRYGGDVLNQYRIVVLGSAYIGYLDLGRSQPVIFAIYVGTPQTRTLDEGFGVFHDLIGMSGLFWEDLVKRQPDAGQ